ncbi:MAG: Lpg1974 family pore-forming outer membrane protein [Candidatus Rhabdochlamydia sp.]
MHNSPFLNIYPFTLAAALFCHLAQAEEMSPPPSIPSSTSYLSFLELKLEKMEHQLKVHQKESMHVTSGLLQMTQTLEEITTLREVMDQTSTKRYSELMALFGTFEEEKQKLLELYQVHLQERQDLLKEQQELLMILNQKADLIDVTLSISNLQTQLLQTTRHLNEKAPYEELSSLKELLFQNTASLNLLEQNFQQITSYQDLMTHVTLQHQNISTKTDQLDQKITSVQGSSLRHEQMISQLQEEQQKRKSLLPEAKSRAYAQLLYWNTLESDLSYTPNFEVISHLENGLFQPMFQNTFSTLAFRWDPGYRLGIGYLAGPESWDFFSEYTYFKNKSTQGSKDFTTAALTYNVWDLALKQPILTTSSTFLQFLMGLRSSFIHQHWNINQMSSDISSLSHQWKMSGVGPRAGVSLDWMWNEHLGAHFQCAGGLVLGWMSRKQTSTFSTPLAVAGVIQNDPTRQTLIPNMDMVAGVQWQQQLEHMKLHLFMNWEFNEWINLNKNYQFITLPSVPTTAQYTTTSLSLQGISMGVGIDF